MSNTQNEINVALLLEQTGWLQRLALGLVGDSHRAEELAQETLLVAVEKPPKSVGELPALRAWLARVARNLAFSSARGERHRVAREADSARGEELPSVAEAVERTELRGRVTEAILELDSPYREVVILRYLEGLNTRQVAERTDATQQAVRTRLSRGLDKLRARLDAEYGGDRRAWMLIVLPLTRGSEPLAVASASATVAAGLLSVKSLAALVLVTALAALSWTGWAGFDSAKVTDAEVASVNSAAIEPGVEPGTSGVESEPVESTASLGAQQSEPSRQPVQLAQDDRRARIQLRVELRPDDPGYAEARRFKRGDSELVLGRARYFLVEAARESQDAFGYPAISIRIGEEEIEAFGDWTESIINESMAILFEEEVLTVAVVKSRLPEAFIIEGGAQHFSPERVAQLLEHWGTSESVFAPYEFHGRVLRASDGLPIDAPTISSERESMAPRVSSGGYFSVQVNSPSEHAVRVEAAGFATVRVEVSPIHSSRAEAQVIDMLATGELRVRVTHADGSPVAESMIRVSMVDASPSRRPRWTPKEEWSRAVVTEVTTDAQGRATLSGLTPEALLQIEVHGPQVADGPGEKYELIQSEPALLQREVVLKPGEERALELALPVTRTLRGLVIDPRGERLAGTEVRLIGPTRVAQNPTLFQAEGWEGTSATSDANGRFRFEGVREGAYHVGVPLDSEVVGPKRTPLCAPTVPIVVNEDSASRDVVIKLRPGLMIAGVVVDAEGERLSGQSVYAWRQGSLEFVQAKMNRKGEFFLAPLPEGRYSVSTLMGSPTHAAEQSARARETTKDGEMLRLVHAPCTLRVKLEAERNLHSGKAVVGLYPVSKPDPFISWSDSVFDVVADDQLLSRDLAPGEYNVVVRHRDGRIALGTSIVLGGDNRKAQVELAWRPGVPLEVRAEGAQRGHSYQVTLDSKLVAVGPFRTGLSDSQLVPAGRLEVRVFDRAGTIVATRTLDAVTGREARVLFDGK